MLTLKEFKKEVIEILEQQPMIGCTVGEEIKWKVHEIMRLAGIKIDLKGG